ncbi:MAG: rod shape-determining protein, partial [Patescibacteria group bacterium]
LNRGLRIAGDELDEAIVSYVRTRYSLLIGRISAEEIKMNIGTATVQKGGEKFYVLRGRDLETGLPKSIRVTSGEIREAIGPVLQQIISRIAETLESSPPELVSDIIEKGIVLAGGGALLAGFDQLISEFVKIPVWICDDPLTAVVRGTAKVLDDPELLRKVRVTGGLR